MIASLNRLSKACPWALSVGHIQYQETCPVILDATVIVFNMTVLTASKVSDAEPIRSNL